MILLSWNTSLFFRQISNGGTDPHDHNFPVLVTLCCSLVSLLLNLPFNSPLHCLHVMNRVWYLPFALLTCPFLLGPYIILSYNTTVLSSALLPTTDLSHCLCQMSLCLIVFVLQLTVFHLQTVMKIILVHITMNTRNIFCQ